MSFRHMAPAKGCGFYILYTMGNDVFMGDYRIFSAKKEPQSCDMYPLYWTTSKEGTYHWHSRVLLSILLMQLYYFNFYVLLHDFKSPISPRNNNAAYFHSLCWHASIDSLYSIQLCFVDSYGYFIPFNRNLCVICSRRSS